MFSIWGDYQSSFEQKYLLSKNDVLITLTGTVGKRDYGHTYRIRNEQNLLLNQRVARIIVDSKNDPIYLDFQFKTKLFFDQFFDVSKGGTGNQANVGVSDIEKIIIPIPSADEQIAIATVLSDTDELITSIDKLIAKKKAIKQGAMQELLTGKKRLPGFEVKKGYKQTEIGEIPVDWKILRLGDLCELTAYPPLITHRVAH